MNRVMVWCILALAAGSLIGGCAPSTSRWDMLYSKLSEEPELLDWKVLEGRRIVIDPGHGGAFRGAVGADSLAEADANLGVALYLWGLLNDAGADVTMTRTTDRDFLPEGSDEIGDDLSARIEYANSLEPEVFLSIHHNSNIALDRSRNRIEVYYDGTDPGASLELAEEIHLHLARNLGIDDAEIRPGNYYVLRNSKANASVLGEASYISHREVEKRLKISTRQKLEAEAYFLGLLSYFARGVPLIESIPFESDTLHFPSSISFKIRPAAGVPLDPGSMRVDFGRRRLESVWDPSRSVLSCPVPRDIPNGPYEVIASVRSIRGATATSRPVRIDVARPARFFIPLPLERGPAEGYTARLLVLDRLGTPVADGTEVSIRPHGHGRGWRGKSSRGKVRFSTDISEAGSSFIIRSGGFCDTLAFDISAVEDGTPFLFFDLGDGSPIPSPRVLLPDGTALTGDSRGVLVMPLSLYTEDIVISARGYRPRLVGPRETADAATACRLGLVPMFGGALSGKKIAIDPAGGGSDAAGTGPDRLRGATVNLELAKRIDRIVTTAGGSAILSRSGEETLSVHERIQKVNSARPHLAIGLRFGSAEPAGRTDFLFKHYPGSEKGTVAAGSLMSALCGLPPCREGSLSESADIFLQQTSCPACEIHAHLSNFSERLFLNPEWLEMEAVAITAGLVSFFSADFIGLAEHSFRVIRDGSPVQGASVCVDGLFTALTDETGTAVFRFMEEGEHLLTIESGDGRRAVYLAATTSASGAGETVLTIE